MIAAVTKYICKNVNQLTTDELSCWEMIQQKTPVYASPFFHPRFTQIMAEHRPDVEVTVIEQGGKPVGFFPFTRSLRNCALAPGLNFSGYEGIIAEPDVPLDLTELLRQSRVKSWNFTKLVASHPQTTSFHYGQGPSQVLNLEGGFEQYCKDKQAAGSNKMKQSRQKYRKLEKRFSSVAFVPFANAEDDLDWMVETKVNQLAAMQEFNFFQTPWTVPVLRAMLHEQRANFQGQLLKLVLDDQTVAVLYLINTLTASHAFICTYDPNPAVMTHSPGLVLDMLTIEHLCSRGFQRLELGWGDARAKTSLSTGHDTLFEGTYDFNPLNRLVKQTWCAGKSYVKQTPYAAPLRKLVRRFRNHTPVATPLDASQDASE